MSAGKYYFAKYDTAVTFMKTLVAVAKEQGFLEVVDVEKALGHSLGIRYDKAQMKKPGWRIVKSSWLDPLPESNKLYAVNFPNVVDLAASYILDHKAYIFVDWSTADKARTAIIKEVGVNGWCPVSKFLAFFPSATITPESNRYGWTQTCMVSYPLSLVPAGSPFVGWTMEFPEPKQIFGELYEMKMSPTDSGKYWHIARFANVGMARVALKVIQQKLDEQNLLSVETVKELWGFSDMPTKISTKDEFRFNPKVWGWRKATMYTDIRVLQSAYGEDGAILVFHHPVRIAKMPEDLPSYEFGYTDSPEKLRGGPGVVSYNIFIPEKNKETARVINEIPDGTGPVTMGEARKIFKGVEVLEKKAPTEQEKFKDRVNNLLDDLDDYMSEKKIKTKYLPDIILDLLSEDAGGDPKALIEACKLKNKALEARKEIKDAVVKEGPK